VTFESEIMSTAFGSDRWKATANALFEATGLSLAVMDSSACSVIDSVNHCPFCDLAVRRVGGAQKMCFDDPPEFLPRSTTETSCRSGLPNYITPIYIDGDIVCTIVVGGFVSSTRERKRLFEKLLAFGVEEDIAREGVRSIPILPKRQVEALVRMVVSNAKDALERASERIRLEQAVSELEVFVEAGREFTERRGIGQDLLEGVLTKGMAVAGADSGSLMLRRAGTDLLEIVAPRGETSNGTHGEVVRFGDGIAGKVAENGRSVLVTGESELLVHSRRPGRHISSAVSVPLSRAGEILGVLNLNISDPNRRLTGDDVRLIERYAYMAAVTIDNARKHRATERAMFELMHLSELAKMLSGVSDTDEVITIANSVIEKTFDFNIGGVVITGWGRDEATITVQRDTSSDAVIHVLGVALGRDLDAEPLERVRTVTHRGELIDDPFDPDEWNVLPVELVINNSVMGYLFVAGGTGQHFDSDDRRLLAGLADHLALAIDKTAMLKRMRDDMAKTLAALTITLDASEHASPGHSDRVMDYAMALGKELDLSIEQVELLRFAGLLHDVGKTGISEEILLKPSKLTDDEMSEVRRHPEIGASIVDQIDFLNAIAPIIMHHHERWDGTGYPMKLSGTDIPHLARILAIADSFDTMTSETPYRRRMSFAEAREELRSGAGSQFDPALVDSFIRAMDRKALAGSTGLFTEHRTSGPQLPL